ncbi:MAG: T9SS type A sorting domain-containing protein [Bacteroidetes bacterium]|nr:T9SS type A sorting domain-containing protein [Bacteroidota bacterium]
MTLSVTCAPAGTPSYYHNTTGLQGTFLGTCMVNTCNAVYYDNGGSGSNYSDNINGVYRTFCPGLPGNCIKATFTSFNINDVGCFSGCPVANCYDALFVENGPTQNSPVIWAGCGTTIPGPFTSTDPSGCLTFRFTSDALVTFSGWAVTLSCVSCAGGPIAISDYDCINASTVCGTSPIIVASDGPGLASECSGCAISENFSHWFEIYIATGGTLGMTIDPVSSTDDFDFSIWGPSLSCSNIQSTSPVRCSYAASTGNTGLGNGALDNSETVTGNGWVSTLNVTSGQTYLLLVNQWSPGDSGFVLMWNGTATLGAPPRAVTVQATDTCINLANGTACAVINAGLAPYTYSWSTGAMGQSCITGLFPGIYTVSVTDATGCSSVAEGVAGNLGSSAITFSKTDLSCYGICSGIADASVTGGYPPYSYAWCCSQGTSSALTGLCSGTYTLTVSDSIGCSAIDTIIITQPTLLSHSITYFNTACDGDSLWKIDLSVSGGTVPYSYQWTDSDSVSMGTSQDIDSLTTGIYFVTITDSKGCQQIDSMNVYQPALFQPDSAIITDVKCNGASTGIINITLTGGITPFTYLWSNGATTQDLNNIFAGIYTVTATDKSNCMVSDTFTITQPPPLVSSIVTTPVLCAGDTTGSADLTVSGGVPPYTFAWANGDSTEDILSGITGTSYVVNIRDSNSCLLKDTAVIGIIDPISLTITKSNVSCYGGNNGSAAVTVTGGAGILIYSWSNGNSTSSAANLIAATYTVTVTDTNGCSAISSTIITQPSALTVTVSKTDASCNGQCNGSATASPSGGTSPYSYAWTGGGTTNSKTGLCAGTYTVTVTDNKGCTANGAATITQPAALTCSLSVVNITCYGLCNGSASASLAGGTSPYSYSWNGGGTTSIKTGLCSGTYTVTVTDSKGCTVTVSQVVTQPSSLILSVTSSGISCSGLCDGNGTANPGGGIPPYSYNWNNGQTLSTATGLCSGSHYITVTDFNGCTASDSINLTAPVSIATNITTSGEYCGQGNGSASVIAAGGNAPYTYNWSNGATASAATGLSGGIYFVTVQDSTGCSAVDSADILSTPPVNAFLSAAGPSCYSSMDGNVEVVITSGTPPFTYLWNTGSSASVISGLLSGSYFVWITDSTGCSDTLSAVLSAPPILVVSVSTTDVTTCGGSDGSATANTTGGTLPYSYQWNTVPPSGGQGASGLAAGTYTVIVTDTNGCAKQATAIVNGVAGTLSVSIIKTDVACPGENDGTATAVVSGGTAPYTYMWSHGQSASAATGLAAGNYSVAVTDALNCSASGSSIITQPSAITISFSNVSNPACGNANGSATASVTGGSPPYTYIWSNNDTAATALNLSAGIQFVQVTDANGCIAYGTLMLNNSGTMTLNYAKTDVKCHGDNDGTINITVSGGSAPYYFSWSDGNSSGDRAGLSGGIYEVVVTGSDSCIATASIEILEASSLSISVSKEDASCGIPDGSAAVFIAGGTPPYSVVWSTGGAGTSVSGLSAGVYSVAVSDSNGCLTTSIITIAISNIGGPAVTVESAIGISCGNPNSGTIDISVSGGSGGYSFLWSNGATTEDVNGLPASQYSVSVTDSLGCLGVSVITLDNELPSQQPVCMVTVDSSSGRNIIVWDKSLASPSVNGFGIYKEGTSMGVFNLIGTVPVSDPNEFLDGVSNPLQRSWRYKIRASDSCGNESDYSDAHKTMHLAIAIGINNRIELIWDPYEGFIYTTFVIFRSVSGGPFDSLDAVPANVTSYTDFSTPPGVILGYVVEARHPSSCTVMAKVKKYNSSKSNTAAQQMPIGIEELRISDCHPDSHRDCGLRIYPNPASESISLEIGGNIEIFFTLYDIFGRRAIKSEIKNPKSEILIKDFSPGIYFYEVKQGDDILGRGKLVIE